MNKARCDALLTVPSAASRFGIASRGLSDIDMTVDPRGNVEASTRRRSVVRRHPQLALVLTAEGLSSTGDAVFWVGLLVWLLGRPHGTGLIALAALARLGPRVVFGAAGGVIADRYDRRRLLVMLDVARAIVMVALTVIVGADGSSGVVLSLIHI